MFEPYLANIKNGVTDIDITAHTSTNTNANAVTDANADADAEHDSAVESSSGEQTGSLELTVTFAVGTDEEAWITLTSDGTVQPAFGGTGTSHNELMAYVNHAVEIWRAVTGDETTEFTLKTQVNA